MNYYKYIAFIINIFKYIYNKIILYKYFNNKIKLNTHLENNIWKAHGYEIIIHPLNLEYVN